MCSDALSSIKTLYNRCITIVIILRTLTAFCLPTHDIAVLYGTPTNMLIEIYVVTIPAITDSTLCVKRQTVLVHSPKIIPEREVVKIN